MSGSQSLITARGLLVIVKNKSLSDLRQLLIFQRDSKSLAKVSWLPKALAVNAGLFIKAFNVEFKRNLNGNLVFLRVLFADIGLVKFDVHLMGPVILLYTA